MKSDDLPERFDFEAKPILPVRVWTEWIKEKPEAAHVPGLQAGNIFEAVVEAINLDGVSPREALYFTLKPNFNDEIYVRLQLPSPVEAWMPFERGDSVIVLNSDGSIHING